MSLFLGPQPRSFSETPLFNRRGWSTFRPALTGSWALLAVGLPDTLVARPDPDGVTAFRTHELRPGWVPSIPRGRRCSPRSEGRAQPAPAASQRPVLMPRLNFPSAESSL